MGRQSKAMVALNSTNFLDNFSGEITSAMSHVVMEIDKLLAEHQAASLQTYWLVGKLIADVEHNPDTYLTESQRAANIDPGNLLMHMFEKIYTPEQLRMTQRFFEMYPDEQDLNNLINLRCPERPMWRLTVSHVQVLTTVPDSEQREALTAQCAEEAYTARALAVEVQEIRGPKNSNSGRHHQAPKGLKQQVQDVINFQRRFISRSEKLWLEDAGVYDAVANAPSQKRSEALHNFLNEIQENFDKMRELIDSHTALCKKAQEAISNENDDVEVEAESHKTARTHNKITRRK